MTEVSLAAQKVLDAVCASTEPDCDTQHLIAAALRAAADQVIPVTKSPWGSTLVPVLSSQESRDRLLAIADELENQ
jgi:hypothetical protein